MSASPEKGLRIGLTGGIGAGKSTVSARLKRLGAIVLDADVAARQAVQPGSVGLELLAGRFGQGILLEDGELNRPALAKRIFADEAQRLAVNALLHPLIQADMLEQEALYRSTQPFVPIFWDVPLLIESGMHMLMDEVWLVTASEEARIKRIMLRDTCKQEEARARIASQMPEEEKRAFASRILDNSLDQPALYAQVDALYRALADARAAMNTGELHGTDGA